MRDLTVLLIDDDPAAPNRLREALGGPSVEPLASLDALAVRTAAAPGPLPVVVSGPVGDLTLAQTAAGAIAAAPGCPVFVLDPAPDLRAGIALVKQGAADYLPRDAEGLAALRETLAAPRPNGLMGCLPHLFDGLPIPVLVLRPGGSRPLYASPAAARLTGLPLDRLMAQDTADLWHDPAEWRRLLDRLETEGGVSGLELRLRCAADEPVWVSLSVGHFDLDAAPALLIALHDVTRLKSAELALKESEDRYKRLAENAPDMIFRWSYKKGFEYVNPAAVEVIGYTPEEHYNDPGLGYRSIHIDDIPIYESVFSELADPEGPRRYCVIRWHHKEGYQVHVEMRMSPIFDERGQLIAIEGIARDVSQHIIARKRLQELAARVTRAHEEERRRLARELHDEIGQALTAAKMRVRMVENALPEGADAAREKLALLGDLCTEVLATVRALSHELRPPLLDEMGWGPAIAWLCESFSERTGLPVTCVNRGGTARLDPDVELVAYRVVQEALTNIARHAGATTARVELDLQDDGLHVLVTDDGHGFDMAALTLADQPGVGLGLLGMRERVDAVGGELRIHTAPGRGTQVRAALPLAKKEAELL